MFHKTTTFVNKFISKMIKNYFYIVFLFICITSLSSFAQDGKQTNGNIEGLSFYPNPVSTGKIYVTSKLGLDKEVIMRYNEFYE